MFICFFKIGWVVEFKNIFLEKGQNRGGGVKKKMGNVFCESFLIWGFQSGVGGFRNIFGKE